MDQHVRVCRDCGEEYRPHVVRCADCGGELEDRFPGSEPPAPPPPEPAAPEAERAGNHVLYETGQIRTLVPMAERLREAGIECWFVEQPGNAEGAPPRYHLLVPEADARGALAAVADLIAPHGDADVHAVVTRFEPGRGYLQCPACGATPPAGAAECPECGLGLGGGEAAEKPLE
jgi:hypothetical protein